MGRDDYHAVPPKFGIFALGKMAETIASMCLHARDALSQPNNAGARFSLLRPSSRPFRKKISGAMFIRFRYAGFHLSQLSVNSFRGILIPIIDVHPSKLENHS